MVLLCVIYHTHESRGLIYKIDSLYEYCRLIVHSFGHKAELSDPAPMSKLSSYMVVVRTVILVESAFHPNSNYGCAVHGSRV